MCDGSDGGVCEVETVFVFLDYVICECGGGGVVNLGAIIGVFLYSVFCTMYCVAVCDEYSISIGSYDIFL